MRAYEQIVEQGGRVADALRAFKTFLFNTDMMAYLAMMAPRLVGLESLLSTRWSCKTINDCIFFLSFND
jgi:hypothetical protein